MIVNTRANITIVKVPKEEINKIDFVQCKEPTQTLEAFKASQSVKPDIIINGGFFQLSSGKPVMDYIDNGVQKANDTTWNSYGIGIKQNGDLCCGYENEGWKDFLTAYPPLIINGKYNTMNIGQELNYSARRSILGYDYNNIYCIVIDSPGATLKEAAGIAATAGCLYAINLDGGGSTRLICRDATYAAAANNRPVDNVIAIYLHQQPKTIYRVQLGAFSSKENADKFCAEIRQVGPNTASAFVKYISPYYKVQVGAFSIKANAENLVKELKSKGYNAFIVKEAI